MAALAHHTGSPTVHLEYKKSFISVVEANIFTPRVKNMDIPVYFLLEHFENALLIPKYEKSSVMPA